MRLWKISLNLLFIGILIATGMELSNIFLSYVDKALAEEETGVKVIVKERGKEKQKKEDLSRYLEGKRTLARNLLDLTPPKREGSEGEKKEDKKVEEVKRLNAKLLGVVSGIKEEAVILEEGKLRRVKVGDEVMGYIVRKIDREGVILERDGEIAYISIEYSGGSPIRETKPAQTIREPEKPPQKSEASSPQVAKTSDGKLVISRDTLNEFLMAPQNFLKGIYIAPYFKDDKPHGFMIRNIANSHIMAKMGVVKGDVIRKVNGIEINTVTDYYNAIRSVTEGDSLTLSIEREGKEIEITCEIR